MKTIKFFALLSCFLLLFGCGTAGGNNVNTGTGSDTIPPTEPGEEEEQEVEHLTGYIISITNEANIQILVTGQHPNSAGSGVSATMYTLEESTKVENTEGGSLDAADLEVGMKVTVWNSGIVAESFPSQSGAMKVVVAASQDEHEQRAVEKALQEVEAGYPWHVEEIEEQGDHQYKITLKNLLDDSEPVEVEVEV